MYDIITTVIMHIMQNLNTRKYVKVCIYASELCKSKFGLDRLKGRHIWFGYIKRET